MLLGTSCYLKSLHSSQWVFLVTTHCGSVVGYNIICESFVILFLLYPIFCDELLISVVLLFVQF